ncbi:MAG: hypothetical protein Q4D38_00220 [Planctomycetia bacterium]|nr:hypothetical protein [Planctomycetia bacterium]
MPRIIYQEFRDQFENTKYPFEDTATLSGDSITLPETLFLDGTFYMTEPYLSEIQVSDTQIRLTVTDDDLHATSLLEDSDMLYFYTDTKKLAGCLVSDKNRLSWLRSLPIGTYTFYRDATSFAVRCRMPVNTMGVASIGVRDNSLTGDVWLVGADGVFLRYVDDKVRFDVLGEVLYKRKACTTAIQTPRYVQTINGMPPDIYGGFRITSTITGNRPSLRTSTDGKAIEIKRLA